MLGILSATLRQSGMPATGGSALYQDGSGAWLAGSVAAVVLLALLGTVLLLLHRSGRLRYAGPSRASAASQRLAGPEGFTCSCIPQVEKARRGWARNRWAAAGFPQSAFRRDGLQAAGETAGRSFGGLPGGAGTWHREPDTVTPQPQPSVEPLGSDQKVDTNFSYFVNPLFAGEAEAEA